MLPQCASGAVILSRNAFFFSVAADSARSLAFLAMCCGLNSSAGENVNFGTQSEKIEEIQMGEKR